MGTDFPDTSATGSQGAAGNMGPYNFVIRKSGSTYEAYLGSTGALTYSGSAASTVIQNCINATATAGGTIHFKTGIYTILVQLSVTHPIVISGEGGEFEDSTFRGTVLHAGAAIASIININIAEAGMTNMNTGCVLRDLSLDGNSLADECLLITDAVRFKAYNCTFANAAVWGLLDVFNHSHFFYGCQFVYCGATGTADSGGACVGTAASPANCVQFYGCNFEANNQVGLRVKYAQMCKVIGGVIEGNYGYGTQVGIGDGNGPINCTTSFIGVAFETNNTASDEEPANIVSNYSMFTTFRDCQFFEDAGNTTYAVDIDDTCPGYYVDNCYCESTFFHLISSIDTVIGAMVCPGTYDGPADWLVDSGASTVQIVAYQ